MTSKPKNIFAIGLTLFILTSLVHGQKIPSELQKNWFSLRPGGLIEFSISKDTIVRKWIDTRKDSITSVEKYAIKNINRHKRVLYLVYKFDDTSYWSAYYYFSIK